MKLWFLFLVLIDDLSVRGNITAQADYQKRDKLTNDTSASGRIVGGGKISIDLVPHQAFIDTETKCNGNTCLYNACGGSIIHPRFILTAAHCLFKEKITRGVKPRILDKRLPGPNSWVRVGSTESEKYGTEIRGRRNVFHGSYHTGGIDLALIMLDEPIKWGLQGRAPQLIQIPNTTEWKRKWDHGPCWVTGWGTTKRKYYWDTLARAESSGLTPNVTSTSRLEPRTSTPLQKAELDILDNPKCKEMFRKFSDPPHKHPAEEAAVHDEAEKVKDTIICAYSNDGGKQDSCQGDSGGPLTCFEKKTRNPMLVGVVRSGLGCGGGGIPGFYTRPGYQSLRKWIIKFIGKYLPQGEKMAPFPEKGN